MLFARARKREAESLRRRLISEDVIDPSVEVERDAEYVYFPLKYGVDGLDVVERAGTRKFRRPTSLKQALAGRLPDSELAALPSSYNVIGDVAVLELPDELLHLKAVIGEALVDTFSGIKVAALKTHMVSGEYRVPGVEVLAGEGRTETVHREHGCAYKLDVASAYFSPRLSAERMRVASQVGAGERVLVLFAGVGPYAVLISKLSSAKVTAVELNPEAVCYLRENVKRNRVDVEVAEGDARAVTPELGSFDRIVMPLPKLADTFLDVAVSVLKDEGIIHYYSFASSSIDASGYLAEVLGGLGLRPQVLDVVECGSYSPVLSRYCVDFKVAGL